MTEHYIGHRKRLRDRFLKGGVNAIADYELLEIVLFGAYSRGDVKPLAKAILKKFHTISGAMSASENELEMIPGLGKAGIVAIKTLQAGVLLTIKEKAFERPYVGNPHSLMKYCQVAMEHLKKEQLRIFFLDRANKLICDEIQQEGTIDYTAIYPREILQATLNLGASAIILVHNHPAGDPLPSDADIKITQDIKNTLNSIDIKLIDHIIVGRNSTYSFRKQEINNSCQ